MKTIIVPLFDRAPIMKLYYTLPCIYIFLSNYSQAQERIYTSDPQADSTIFIPEGTQKDDTPAEYNIIESLGQNLVIQASSPFRMNDDELLWAAGGLAITGTLIYYDEDIDKVFKPIRSNNPSIKEASEYLTQLGGTPIFLSTIAYIGYSYIWNDTKGKKNSAMLTEALVTSGVWVQLGKLLSARERPSAKYQYSRFPGGYWYPLKTIVTRPWVSDAQHDAFPAGHSQTAFAIATVFAEQYNENYVVPILAYTLASVVGITRMIEHTHWASDVFVGSALGYLCGKQVVRRYNEYYDQKDVDSKLIFGIVGDSPGVIYSITF